MLLRWLSAVCWVTRNIAPRWAWRVAGAPSLNSPCKLKPLVCGRFTVNYYLRRTGIPDSLTWNTQDFPMLSRNRTTMPLRRSLIKMGMRALLGRTRAHYYAWSPHLEIIRERSGSEIRYRHRRIVLLENAASLVGRGTEINIVGSGPSIHSQDVGVVAAQSCLFLNGSIVLMRDFSIKPLAVVIEDERFVWKHFTLMKVLIPAETLCLLSPESIRATCELDAGWLRDKRVILIDDIRKPYLQRRANDYELSQLNYVRLSPDSRAGFSLQPDRGVFHGGSVVVSALQFAVYAKPERIGLLGIDLGNANQPRFYETEPGAAKSKILKGQKRIIEHIILGKKICAEQKIELTLHSPVSSLLGHGFSYDRRFEREAC